MILYGVRSRFFFVGGFTKSVITWVNRHRVHDWPCIRGGSARLPRLAKALSKFSQAHLILLDYREKVGSRPQRGPFFLIFVAQDGYTMEMLDIHGVNGDGNDTVIIHNVSVFMIYAHPFQWPSSFHTLTGICTWYPPFCLPSGEINHIQRVAVLRWA